MKDFYKILGLDFSNRNKIPASKIKSQYKKLSLQFHPDKHTEVDPEIIKNINEAYEVLSDEEERDKYDEKFNEWSSNKYLYINDSLISFMFAQATYIQIKSSLKAKIKNIGILAFAHGLKDETFEILQQDLVQLNNQELKLREILTSVENYYSSLAPEIKNQDGDKNSIKVYKSESRKEVKKNVGSLNIHRLFGSNKIADDQEQTSNTFFTHDNKKNVTSEPVSLFNTPIILLLKGNNLLEKAGFVELEQTRQKITQTISELTQLSSSLQKNLAKAETSLKNSKQQPQSISPLIRQPFSIKQPSFRYSSPSRMTFNNATSNKKADNYRTNVNNLLSTYNDAFENLDFPSASFELALLSSMTAMIAAASNRDRMPNESTKKAYLQLLFITTMLFGLYSYQTSASLITEQIFSTFNLAFSQQQSYSISKEKIAFKFDLSLTDIISAKKDTIGNLDIRLNKELSIHVLKDIKNSLYKSGISSLLRNRNETIHGDHEITILRFDVKKFEKFMAEEPELNTSMKF